MTKLLISIVLIFSLFKLSIADGDPLFAIVGEKWNHEPLFKPPVHNSNPKFVADTESQREQKVKLDNDWTLRQHTIEKRDAMSDSLRIGPENKREVTVTVRYTLRLL